jgi:uridine kinase
MSQPFFIAIVGGGHCGKSSFAKTLKEVLQAKLSSEEVCLIEESSYLETSEGAVESKEYNYTRLAEDLGKRTEKVIIVEGFYLLSRPETRLKFNESLFIDMTEEERFDRKLKSQTTEGLSALDVYKEFHGLDKPLYDRFIGPSKVHAKRVIKASDFIRELNKFAELILKLI